LGLGKIPGLPPEGGERYADRIPGIAPKSQRVGGSPTNMTEHVRKKYKENMKEYYYNSY